MRSKNIMPVCVNKGQSSDDTVFYCSPKFRLKKKGNLNKDQI